MAESTRARQRYLRAAETLVDIVDRVPADAWDGPGLGGWSLRDLAGHTVSSGLRVVAAVLATRAPQPDLPTAEAYYALARTVDPGVYRAAVAASTEDSRSNGAALGDAPTAVIRGLVAEVTARLDTVDDDDVVQTPAGGMRVADWLASRAFELTVHGMDLASAAGVPARMPDNLVAEAAVLAARIGAAVGDGSQVLLALTGRRALPDGFSVL